MCCYSICSIKFCYRIFITKTIFIKNNNIVFIIIFSKNGIVMSVMVITFNHQACRNIPQYIMVNSCVPPLIGTSCGTIHPNSVFFRVVNPIVSNIGIFLFCHHHLYNGSITLQQTCIPYFVIHYSWCIAYGNSG